MSLENEKAHRIVLGIYVFFFLNKLFIALFDNKKQGTKQTETNGKK